MCGKRGKRHHTHVSKAKVILYAGCIVSGGHIKMQQLDELAHSESTSFTERKKQSQPTLTTSSGAEIPAVWRQSKHVQIWWPEYNDTTAVIRLYAYSWTILIKKYIFKALYKHTYINITFKAHLKENEQKADQW